MERMSILMAQKVSKTTLRNCVALQFLYSGASKPPWTEDNKLASKETPCVEDTSSSNYICWAVCPLDREDLGVDT